MKSALDSEGDSFTGDLQNRIYKVYENKQKKKRGEERSQGKEEYSRRTEQQKKKKWICKKKRLSIKVTQQHFGCHCIHI